jgi:hypothetical protein
MRIPLLGEVIISASNYIISIQDYFVAMETMALIVYSLRSILSPDGRKYTFMRKKTP